MKEDGSLNTDMLGTISTELGFGRPNDFVNR